MTVQIKQPIFVLSYDAKVVMYESWSNDITKNKHKFFWRGAHEPKERNGCQDSVPYQLQI